ncbi:sulfate permease [Tistrella mobilis]|uniref:SulP family inorganic anion transporter n=1 Tax=Tistrella mobilis TaxID=171437 RepID=UPI0035589E55
MARFRPAALDWLRRYDGRTAGADGLAAVIVTIMLVPQSLAYAMLAGLPPAAGLYASILPLIAYAAFGSSRTLAVGPVAVISLMTAAATAEAAAATGIDPAAAALLLAGLSGVMLLAMAALRLGFVANFLSHPVVGGFITASGLLIALGQAGHLLGVSARGDTLPAILTALYEGLFTRGINLPTLVVGGLSLIFLFWCRKRLKPLLVKCGFGPRAADAVAKAAPAVAVLASILAVGQLDLAAAGVKVVGALPSGLPPLTLPPLEADAVLALLGPAALISLIGFVESISVAQTLAAKRRQRISADAELVGLGAANIAAAVTGGYPVTGGFARSVVNFDAGAETPMAGVFTALGIALAALVLTPAFRDLPQAVLAATIIVAVLSLVDLRAPLRAWAYSRADGIAMAVTILGVLVAGVEVGILAGVVASLALFLRHSARPHMAVVGQVPGSEHFRNVDRHRVAVSDTVLTVRIDESLYFANARALEDRISSLVACRPALRHVVLMCPAVNLIDLSALESLEAINRRLAEAGISFHLSEVKGPVMDRLARSHFLDELTGRVFLSQHAAMQALDPDLTRAADGTVQAAAS